MDKAKDFHKGKIREKRKALLEALDIEFIRALETGADTSTIVSKKNAYLSIGDQLDLLYKDIIAGTLDANGGFAKAIKEVKDNYPKPS